MVHIANVNLLGITFTAGSTGTQVTSWHALQKAVQKDMRCPGAFKQIRAKRGNISEVDFGWRGGKSVNLSAVSGGRQDWPIRRIE